MNEFPDAPDRARRMILKGAVAGGLAGLGLGSFPFPAFADADAKDWPADAFKQKSEADALKSLYGKSAEASDKISLDAPEIAENGAVVPISITSTLPNVTGIAILVLENPFTLAAAYKIPEGTQRRGREPAEDGEDQQGRRGRGIGRQALQRDQGSQSHRRRLRRLTGIKEQDNGIDHPRPRRRQRRHHRSAVADPTPDGFRLCQGLQRRS